MWEVSSEAPVPVRADDRSQCHGLEVRGQWNVDPMGQSRTLTRPPQNKGRHGRVGHHGLGVETGDGGSLMKKHHLVELVPWPPKQMNSAQYRQS
uniref:Uncharacterized protein n=1 Tax=Arundo donax TaxID=35708 RepID=A0A0A9CPR6_ARUDO